MILEENRNDALASAMNSVYEEKTSESVVFNTDTPEVPSRESQELPNPIMQPAIADPLAREELPQQAASSVVQPRAASGMLRLAKTFVILVLLLVLGIAIGMGLEWLFPTPSAMLR